MTPTERITKAIEHWQQYRAELLPLFPFKQRHITYTSRFPANLDYWVALWQSEAIGEDLAVQYIVRPMRAIWREYLAMRNIGH